MSYRELEIALHDDRVAAEAGRRIAEALKVERNIPHRTWFETQWGCKTAAGLARAVLDVIIYEATQADLRNDRRGQ